MTPIMFDREIQIRQGAYLPHWTKEGGIYHIRFRLADSLPQEKLREWKEERKEILKEAARQKRRLSVSEQKRLDFLYSAKVEKWLDAGHGACWLRQNEVASIVATTLHFFHEDRYRLLVWCVMPNHVHVLMEPITHSLVDILDSWKKFTARKANKMLGREGKSFWQREYFDHLIRNREHLERTSNYIWNNPEAAGLVNWKWRWRME